MITIAVPQKGRTLNLILSHLATIGAVKRSEQGFVADTMAEDKKRISQAGNRSTESNSTYIDARKLDKTLENIRANNSYGHMLKVDYDCSRVGHPPRILFRGLETSIEGIPVRIIGRSTSDIPAALSNHEAHLGYVGWDHLYANCIELLDNKKIKEWSAFNGALPLHASDVRILGSADFNDLIGHFVLASGHIGEKILEIDFDEEAGTPKYWVYYNEPPLSINEGDFGNIYVDPQFQRIYQHLLPGWKDLFQGSHQVELDISRNCAFGIYGVQSARTAYNNKLSLLGQPLITSETLLVVNTDRLAGDHNLISVAKSLQPRTQETWGSVYDHLHWTSLMAAVPGRNHCLFRGYAETWQVPGKVTPSTSTMHHRGPAMEPALLLMK